MKKHRKLIFNSILFAGIFMGTMWGVFHGEDLSEIWEDLSECNPYWLLPAIGCVFFFIGGESIILWYLLNSYGVRIKKAICFLFSSVGFFFSCVTPSAGGGQPMQVVFMRKAKIPVPVASVILLIVTITYKSVLVVVGLGILFFARMLREQYLSSILPVFYFGIFLNVICVVLMAELVFHPSLVRRIVNSLTTILQRWHILKDKDGLLQKLDHSIDSYHETAQFMKEHIMMVVNVFVITMAQRMALFAVPCFVYRALGLSGTHWFTILLLQACVSVSVDMLPLPGGMGISETLILIIFVPVFGELLLPGMVLSRGLGYYSELLISALFTMVAVLVIGRKNKEYLF